MNNVRTTVMKSVMGDVMDAEINTMKTNRTDRPTTDDECGSSPDERDNTADADGAAVEVQPLSSSGAHAALLIQRQTRRLGKLQPEVLADHDPEPLHQLRVSLRRLRTVLQQFAPALVLPDTISDRRMAKVARHTGLTRDLDVLQQRLHGSLIPLLPAEEQKALRPVLKRLKRERRQAFEGLEEALRSGPYLKLLARLHHWQAQPRFTPLGKQPLRSWLLEWQATASASLFLHDGWFATDPHDPALHELRKRLKALRYTLEPLEELVGPSLSRWIALLRQAQDHLGELHDLQVLSEGLFDPQRPGQPEISLPALQAEISRAQAQQWRGWRELAGTLHGAAARQELQAILLDASRLPAT
jgi:CHAD domain-containing protein